MTSPTNYPGVDHDRATLGTDDFTAATVTVLEVLAENASVDFDPVVASHAWTSAEREYPGAFRQTWTRRLVRAGQSIGLRVAVLDRPLVEAIALIKARAPVVVIAGTDAHPEWLILIESKGKQVLARDAKGKVEWFSRDELARQLNLKATKDRIVFGVAHALAPCEEMRRDDHGHDGEHEHGRGAHGPARTYHDPLRRLLALLRPEAPDIWIVVVYSLTIGILMLATPLAVESLVNTVAFGGLAQPVIVLSLLLFTCLGFAALLTALQTYVTEIIQRRIFVRVAADLAYRLPRVRVEVFDRSHGPELVNRFFDVLTVQKVSASLMMDALSIFLAALIGLVVLAFYHPFLLGYDILLLSSLTFLVYNLGRGGVRTSVDESLAKYKVQSFLEELARQPMAFKLAGGPAHALERIDGLARAYVLARQDHFRVLIRQICFMLGLQAVANTSLLGLGGWLVVAGQLTLGQLIAAEMIVTAIVGSAAKMGKHLENYYDLMAAVDKLGHLIDLPLERQGGESFPRMDRPAALRVEGVDFEFEDDRPVLAGTTFAVAPGERVAVVGVSGSGKSTLVELIFGLRSPKNGHILLDDVDLRDLRLESLRDQVAAVQTLEIFEGTLIENVRTGRRDVSLARVRESLEIVGLLDEVMALPDGLQTRLQTGGAPLSGGHAMRLLIARAIAGRPRLLVLDETIDNMDVHVRDQIISALFDRAAPWTLVVVTHNPDVSCRCDRKILLARGKTQEQAVYPPAVRSDSRVP